ncbi:MAG: PKD domain-containing protein, partial [Bacteroidia bacterium]
MKNKLTLSTVLAFAIGATAFAQSSKTGIKTTSNLKNWLQLKQTGANFYDVQKSFYSNPENVGIRGGNEGEDEEKDNAGWELFKRWEYFAAPRVYPSGDVSQLSETHVNYQAYLNAQKLKPISTLSTLSTNTWSYLGPNSEPTTGGVGRVNVMAYDASTSTLWAGAPDGGLWKSTNNGTTWATTTDLFTDLGVTDIAIDPTSSGKTIYVATGDRDGAGGAANHVYAYGLMKTTDGGITWIQLPGTGFAISQNALMSRVLIDPSNTQNIYLSGNFGLLKSTNGGTSWSPVASLNGDYVIDMAFKPGLSSTIYATTYDIGSGSAFYISTNSGASFTQVTSGLPAPTAVIRMSIAVSAANAAYVYVLAADVNNNGLYGVYQSTNSGTSFTQKHGSSSPNLLGFNQNGSDAGVGQGFYTLSIAANPTNANEIIVGGVNVWKSTNGGTSWGANCIAYWAAANPSSGYVHADIHHILYINGTSAYIGCDGGVFETTNDCTTWSDLSNNMQIGQMYGLGMSTTNANKILSGWQDNGTNLMASTSNWNESMGGDGMKCFIDHSNDNVMYGEQYQGSFNVTTNGGASWNSIGPPASENTAWATPWKQDPNVANTIYGGMTNLYKSTNQGTSWSQIGTQPDGSNYINEFAIAPSNSNVIYVVKNTGVYKTTNGGGSWATINSGLPTGSAAASYVAICPTNANIAYVTFSGYSSGNKIFVTSNGGTSWTNYSTGLPNLPANCITYQKNAHGAVYAGMDVGVYYRDSTLGSWQPYNTGLPNVIVSQMEIYYGTGMIRASTFGRGIWEIPVNNPGSNPPAANFVGTPTTICPGTTVNFTDLSGYNPTSWSWTFSGGTPGTSTVQNPSVIYNTAGSYNATLTATNSNGSNAMTKTAYINVSGPQALPLSEGFEGATFPPANWGLNAYPFEWQHNTTVGHNSTKCAEFDNTDTNAVGTRSYMLTPKYNFASLSSAKLFFDVAYTPYDKHYSDSLAVYISKDCGQTYTQLYLKGGLTLSTTGAYDSTGAFVPTNTQWRTDTISLNAYVGQPSILIKFENRPGYGQALYLDNVNITGVNASAPPTASYTATSSPVCKGSSITYTSTSSGGPTSYSWIFQSGTPGTSSTASQVVTYNTAGTYTVSLTATNSNGSN